MLRIIEDEKLTAIADKIRTATGTTETMTDDEMPAKIDEVFSAARKAEYDRFWDVYQDYGNRKNYDNAFGGTGWTEETFKPKYLPIRLSGNVGYQMFSRSSVGRIDESILDTSEATAFSMSFYYFFLNQGHNLYYISVDCSSLSSVDTSFNYNHTLRTLVMKNIQETCDFTDGFNGCDALTDFTVTGTIGKTTLNLQWSKVLSVESAKNLIQHLKNHSGTDAAYTCTLRFHDNVWKALEADSTSPSGGTWAEYVASLGWLT